jgi:hypothetical protein
MAAFFRAADFSKLDLFSFSAQGEIENKLINKRNLGT